MCGRFCLFSSSKELSNDLGIHINKNIEPSYNVSPGDTVLSVYFDFEKQKRAFGFFKWGLQTPQNFHINARIESIDSAPRFRDAWTTHRCLIPSNGFFEWYKDGLTKQPYYIYAQDQKPLYFGALYYPISKNEHQIVIITTEATASIDRIHERMPLVIPKEFHAQWLRNEGKKEALLQTQKSFALSAHTVSNRINRRNENDANLIGKQDPINEGQLRLF